MGASTPPHHLEVPLREPEPFTDEVTAKPTAVPALGLLKVSGVFATNTTLPSPEEPIVNPASTKEAIVLPIEMFDAPEVIAIPTLRPAPTTDGVEPAPATLNQKTTFCSAATVSIADDVPPGP